MVSYYIKKMAYTNKAVKVFRKKCRKITTDKEWQKIESIINFKCTNPKSKFEEICEMLGKERSEKLKKKFSKDKYKKYLDDKKEDIKNFKNSTYVMSYENYLKMVSS